MDDELRPGRRDSAEWRGEITEKVRSHENKFRELNGDLRDLRNEVTEWRKDTIVLQGQVSEARNDIAEATASMKKDREQETNQLRDAIKETKITTKDMWLHVAAPIAVLVIGSIILLLIVGKGAVG